MSKRFEDFWEIGSRIDLILGDGSQGFAEVGKGGVSYGSHEGLEFTDNLSPALHGTGPDFNDLHFTSGEFIVFATRSFQIYDDFHY